MWSFWFIFPAAFGCRSFPQAKICSINVTSIFCLNEFIKRQNRGFAIVFNQLCQKICSCWYSLKKKRKYPFRILFSYFVIISRNQTYKLRSDRENYMMGMLLLHGYFFFFCCCWQKWHCVEEITGKWRIQKCKGSAKEGSRKRARSLRPRGGYDNRDRGCDCGDAAFKPSKMDRRSHRQLSSGQREYTRTCYSPCLILYRKIKASKEMEDWISTCVGLLWLFQLNSGEYGMGGLLQSTSSFFFFELIIMFWCLLLNTN